MPQRPRAGTDYLGWSPAEIKYGHPIENAAERRAWKAYDKPKAFRTSYGKAGGGTLDRLARYGGGGRPPRKVAAAAAPPPNPSGPNKGKNLGTFKHRSGHWKKGAGGRFVGSGG